MPFPSSRARHRHPSSPPVPAAVGEASRMGYTPAVNTRRLLGTASSPPVPRGVTVAGLALTLFLAPSAFAQAKPPPKESAEAARAAGQAARAAASMADEVADSEIERADSAEAPVENARNGVVTLERKGKPIGLGTVLQGDGRILTALSNVGHGNGIDARLPDGSLMPLRMGHSDRAWDLALLVPQSGRWTQGLRAGSTDARKSGASLRTFTPVAKGELAPSRLIVRGLRTMQGADSELLRDAIELGSRLKATDVGSPIIDDGGRVVGMVARACAPVPGQDCQTVPFGVPVTAVKAFLRTVPRSAVPPAPWLGLQGVAADAGPVRGVRVLKLHPRSAAAAAGLRAGSGELSDVIVAVDGSPVMTPEALASAVNERAVGDSVELLLFGGGKFRQVSLALTAAPPEPGAKQPAGSKSQGGKAQGDKQLAKPPQVRPLRRAPPAPRPR